MCWRSSAAITGAAALLPTLVIRSLLLPFGAVRPHGQLMQTLMIPGGYSVLIRHPLGIAARSPCARST